MPLLKVRTNGFRPYEKMLSVPEIQTNSTPFHDFMKRSKAWSLDIDSEEFAQQMDREDPLREFRKLFHYPKKRFLLNVDEENLEDENEETIYFCGHSLGLQLKSVKATVKNVLKDWAQQGVECHFNGSLPAAHCDKSLKEKMAYLAGALPEEVTAMNGLTVNIHMLLASFYRPTAMRHKILMVTNGFHSDLYAVQSHIELRGYDPEESMIFLKPRPGSDIINTEDIRKMIEKEGKNIAVIFLEGVHFYTGQLFDMKEITRMGHEKGCVVGFDLAHAIGNVPLQLHDWNVDFAIWCTYKYLNSGPGCMGAAYCHERHMQGDNAIIPAIRGWWGLSDKKKFAFDQEFTPAEGADRFKLSNPSPYLSAMILANLEVFKEAGVERIQAKQRLLTGYLEYLIRKHFPQYDETDQDKPHIRIITPSSPKNRGSQLSLVSSVPVSKCESIMKAKGIVCDIRKGSVIRVAPAPLYNKFSEVYRFVHTLKNIWEDEFCSETPEQ
ncbi:kynureninase [Nephila pilipes]|uniref:Kynureninase n=1 Tax=Nephila pilipes TaxID=299642 RepID=A0A8X6U9Y5_NEPPI|nr:kynureninase [Nephila pilipes]